MRLSYNFEKSTKAIAVLRVAVVLIAFAFLIHALFTQFYERGVARIFSPVIAVGFVLLFVAFFFRQPWSWRGVRWAAPLLVVVNLAFLPQQEHFGEHVLFARVLIAAEVLLSAIIAGFMLHPATKRWFFNNQAANFPENTAI